VNLPDDFLARVKAALPDYDPGDDLGWVLIAKMKSAKTAERYQSLRQLFAELQDLQNSHKTGTCNSDRESPPSGRLDEGACQS